MIDLTAFVPRLAAELAVDDRSTYTKVDGSMLSADISGFTALSEKLAGKGKAGAEEITELINVCFTALIDAAYGYGGEIIKFGGDALLVLFRGERHRRRCANAALAMQIALHSSPTAKRANLTMTVGASHGPFDVFLAGSNYRELLIIGPAASQVIHLEGGAGKGETLVSHEIAATLPAGMTGREHAGGIAIVGEPPDPPGAPAARVHGGARMEAFVPTQVLEQLSAFTELGGEHRLVSVGFVMVGGVEAALHEAGPDGTATALGALVDDVIAATLPYGVTALHTDIAPDGFKFVLCAGAPVNPGDISDALLQAALSIAAIDSRFTLRQGAQTGRVFAGFLGAPYRRTYTLMGDPVNTAARMLGKAGDREIVAVGSMVDDTRSVFDAEQLEPFRVKGKTEPIIAYQVRGITDGVRRDGTHTHLVGRERELEVLSRAIGELGEIIDIVGPAGVGKSRLLDAAWDEAEGLVHLHGSCAPYGATSPYSVFRPLLRGSLGIDPRADPRSAGAHLSAVVERRAPRLLARLPLLAVPFGADVASTPEVDAIDPEFRRARIHEAIVDLYDTTLAGRPVFMVIEDLHWVDDASGELVNYLVRAAATRAWAGVTTRRPEGTWEMDNQLPHVTTIELRPLTDDDIRRVAIEASERSLSDGTLDLIVERSQGNPLFALELTRAAGRGEVAQLPDSVEKVISSRIDELPPGLRHLVRIASVFGNSFDADDIAPVLARESPGLGVADPDLADILEPRNERTWTFRHALYRDVAYEGLPYRQRRMLHAQVAEHLESSTSDPDRLAALLSVHYSAARAHDKAWRYSKLAGEEALASYANQEAIQSLERALASARYCRGLDAADKADARRLLGNAYEFSGDLSAAYASYERQRRLAPTVEQRVSAMRRMARARQKQGRLTAAVRLLSAAERDLADVRRDRWVHQRLAEIHLNMAGIRMDQGRLNDARSHGERAEQHATEAGDDALRVQAYGAIVGALTSWDEAEPYETGLRLAQEIDAHEAASILATNLGMSAYFAGQWQRAVELYEQGGVTARAMGNVMLATAASMNAAEILVDQGHLDVAGEALRDVCRVFEAAGYESALLYAELNLGTALMRGVDPETGRAMLMRCADGFRGGAMQLYAVEADVRVAESHLRAGQVDQARAILLAALAAAPSLDRGTLIEARAQRLLGVAALHDGDLPSAREAFERAEVICHDGNLPFELAMTLLGRHAVTADEALFEQADAILHDLGVVSVPFHNWQP